MELKGAILFPLPPAHPHETLLQLLACLLFVSFNSKNLGKYCHPSAKLKSMILLTNTRPVLKNGFKTGLFVLNTK